MEQMFILSFLGINSYLDIRQRRISLGLTAVYGIMGIFYILFSRQRLLILLLGALPGLLLVCIGKASGGGLGMGDGLIVWVSGMYLGIWKTLEFISLAFLLAAVWAGFLMTVRKKGRKADFPFVPFLLAAYGMLCMIRLLEG